MVSSQLPSLPNDGDIGESPFILTLYLLGLILIVFNTLDGLSLDKHVLWIVSYEVWLAIGKGCLWIANHSQSWIQIIC